jgi:hypothetical protein
MKEKMCCWPKRSRRSEPVWNSVNPTTKTLTNIIKSKPSTAFPKNCSDGNRAVISKLRCNVLCRYTETDSRPLTPAPTLASAATRASGSRRCVTPDPLPTNQIREKTLLILDLRRSHSQVNRSRKHVQITFNVKKLETRLFIMQYSTNELAVLGLQFIYKVNV